jgi:hypothetical protein
MKKITFILFALIVGTGFAQNNAQGTAEAFAEIVSPITISETGSDLNFGKIAKDGTAGTVIIGLDGNRTGTASVIPDSETTAAGFTVTAAASTPFIITLPNSVTLTGTDGTMIVDEFNHNLGDNPTGTGSNQDLLIGATLNVGASQNEGLYSGTINVTVAYE